MGPCASASATNSLILTVADQIGGSSSTAPVVFGIAQAIRSSLRRPGHHPRLRWYGFCARGHNATTLGPVTVNRGVTLNINGNGLGAPVGQGVVTALGGTISTDNATSAKFGNTDFRLYGSSTLLLDNRAVTVAGADRRLANTTDIARFPPYFLTRWTAGRRAAVSRPR